MSARRPRLLTKIDRRKPREDVYVPKPYIPPVKTEVDVLYDLIDERSCRGYRFCESYVTLPYIHKEDIEDRGNGLFVVRFRCPVENEFYGMPDVVKEVCERIGSGEHFVYEKKEEFGLPFIEAAWVLQRGEIHASELDFSGCGGGDARSDGVSLEGNDIAVENADDGEAIHGGNSVPNGERREDEAGEDGFVGCGSDLDVRDESICSLSAEEMRRMMDVADREFA